MAKIKRKTESAVDVGSTRLLGWRDWIVGMAEGIWKAFRPPKRKRLELLLCTWPTADRLIRESRGLWRVAEEDDQNTVLGCVWIERLEEYPRFDAQPNRPS